MKKILTLYSLITLAGVKFSSAQTHVLMGTCYGAGSDSGSIFQVNLDGSNLHTIYSFHSIEGANPYGKTAQAPNGKIYGVTFAGGCDDSCTLYEYDPVLNTCVDLYDFYCDTPSTEPSPNGLILLPDGNLYGLGQSGITYKFNPNTHLFTLLNQTLGVTYFGGLMQASDDKLYGLSYNGGTNGFGYIFSYDLLAQTYAVEYSFDSIHGKNPYYENLIQATDGKSYGTTFSGGAYNRGVIFSYDISSNTFTDIHDFDGTNGYACYGGLIQATDGKLYGMTRYGGILNGVIFCYDLTSSQYNVLHSFNGADGANPYGSLTQASNGKLFGTTYNGGTSNQGVAFSFDIAGNTYTKLTDFSLGTGRHPQSDMMEATLTETGITEHNFNSGIITYPNPFKSTLAIKTASSSTITLFDYKGKEILRTSANTEETVLNTESIAAGFYLLRVDASTGSATGQGQVAYYKVVKAN